MLKLSLIFLLAFGLLFAGSVTNNGGNASATPSINNPGVVHTMDGGLFPPPPPPPKDYDGGGKG